MHNCKYSILFFILVSLFFGYDRESFPFFSLFFAYCCAFSINYPRRQQRNFLYLHKQYYSCSLISHMYSYFVIEIILMSFFFFSLSLSLSLFLSCIWNNLFNLCVSFEIFFFRSLSYFIIVVS